MVNKYFVKDEETTAYLTRAKNSFSTFSENKDQEALKNALYFSKKALKKSKNSDVDTDYAHCLRRYASIIVRDKETSHRYQKAQKYLVESIDIFNRAIASNIFYVNPAAMIQIEKQRALHQMRKCAYELNEGALLKSTVKELLALQDPSEMNNYYVDCHESLFHLAFANKSYKLARFHLSMIKQACKEDDMKILTWQRHQCKLRLAEIEQNAYAAPQSVLVEKFNKYEALFYETLEARIEAVKATNKLSYYKQLFKDFVFLFNLRVQKSLLGLLEGKNKINFDPKTYVLILASEGIFPKKIIAELNNILFKKIVFMKEKNLLPLDYKYLSVFNSLKITSEQFNQIFNYDKLVLANMAFKNITETKNSTRKSSPIDELPKIPLNPNAKPFMSSSAQSFMIFKPDAKAFEPSRLGLGPTAFHVG